jgi:hypothetical protein
MSDETEGWEAIASWGFKKQIGNNVFQVWDWSHDPEKGFGLSTECASMNFTYRPTLRECQLLAHATARLWAGEAHP